METKIFAVIAIMLIIGLVSGYLLGSVSQQNQALSFEEELDSKNLQIASLQTEVQDLEGQLESKENQIMDLQADIQTLEEQTTAANSQLTSLEEEIETLNSQILTLQSEIQSLNNQIDSKNQQIADLETEVDSMRVSVEVEEIKWNAAADTANVTLRNTGGVNVTVTSISLKETSGEDWYRDTTTAATGLVSTGETRILIWDGTGLGLDLLPATSYTVQVDYSSDYVTQYTAIIPW
jgi:peptidoglycan hydrolase CwlO-like protein